MDEIILAVPSSDGLIARLVAYCDEQHAQTTLTKFCQRHSHIFADATDIDSECSHAMHDLFQEYEKLFEELIQDFLDQEQLTDQDFYYHCQRLFSSPKQETAAYNIDCILSALDFNHFYLMMQQESKQTQQAMQAAEDMGL